MSIYSSLALYYDRIYHWKDYAAEASALVTCLDAEGTAPGARLLEAACGTGLHMAELCDRYDVAGFDLSEDMLRVARSRLPQIRLWQADMQDFEVDEPFDGLLCLFSSIGYLLGRDALSRAAHAFARALRPGGVALIEPWFTAEMWDVGRPNLQTYQDEDLKLARATVASQRDDIAVMDMHWLVAERGKEIVHAIDRHEMWLCSHETLVDVFDEAGFEARIDPDGLMEERGLLIARKR